jgi:hypothetical protein
MSPPKGICRWNVHGSPNPSGMGDGLALSARNLEVRSPLMSGLCYPELPVGCDHCAHSTMQGTTGGVCDLVVNDAGEPLDVDACGFCNFSTQLVGRTDES